MLEPPEYNTLIGNFYAPLLMMSWRCAGCEKHHPIRAVHIYRRFGLRARVGDVAKELSKDCRIIDGHGDRRCKFLPVTARITKNGR